MSRPLREPGLLGSGLATLLHQQTSQPPRRLPRLPQAPEQQDPLGFDALREAAIHLAQAASCTQWTDYNLHDPGVTLLEAFCYALTEDIYAHRQSVPDLLGLLPSDSRFGDATGRTVNASALAQFALHGPREVLSCRPTTADDYQRWLYDLWPEERHLLMRPLDDHRQRPTGLWQLSRQAHRADAGASASALTRSLDQTRAYWAQRNLGEDLLDAQQLLKPRWVRLRIQLRVDGERDLAELLAELLTHCDDYIAARPRRHPLDEKPDAQRDAGPLMSQGWVSDTELERCGAGELKFNDLALCLRDVPGLLSVEQLRLEETPVLRALSRLEPLVPPLEASNSLPLRGGDWALRLAWPARPDDLEGWRVLTQGSEEQIPLQQLWQQLEDVRRTPRREAVPKTSEPSRRNSREPAGMESDYVAASSHLPALYRSLGTGTHALEPSSGTKGQRLQWHAYLALLEQWLAHSRAQRQHLGELFSIGGALHPSYRWDLPGNAQLAGLEPTPRGRPSDHQRLDASGEGLYLRSREQLERDIFAPADDALERRSRVLDQLLALHGEQLDFQALQGLPCYWSGAAWSRHLLRCKQRFARRLLVLTGKRGGAFDYSRLLLGSRTNFAPLSLRLALQLGMAHPFPRLLMRPLQLLDLKLGPDQAQMSLEPPALHASEQCQPLHLLPGSRPPQRGVELRRLWQQLRERLPLLRQPLPPALLRSAVHAERFMLRSQAGRLSLCLGGEDTAQQWQLADVADAAQGLQLATDLHQLVCALQRHAEGLHLVEHVLLRPSGQPAARLAAFHRQRLSLVLPAWTARGADPRFQSLCREALLMHAPAHLESRALFLDANELASFEDLYTAWLDIKRQDCQNRTAGHRASQQLDACAAALSGFLQPYWEKRART